TPILPFAADIPLRAVRGSACLTASWFCRARAEPERWCCALPCARQSRAGMAQLPGCRGAERRVGGHRTRRRLPVARGGSGELCRPRGLVRVGFFSAAGGRIVVEVADAFRARYPDCEVRIREVDFSDGIGPLLHAGELDMVLSLIGEPGLTASPALFRAR